VVWSGVSVNGNGMVTATGQNHNFYINTKLETFPVLKLEFHQKRL